MVANLEGAVLDASPEHRRGRRVFNDPSVLPYLERLNTRVVTVANNHVFDIESSPRGTLRALESSGILACGAGADLEGASRPAVLPGADRPWVFLAFGWPPLECRVATRRRPGVNPLNPRWVLRCLSKTRDAYKDARIVLLMHWNFELETYPQPAHRELAFRAIEAGADGVVGAHSHRAQGIEVYRGAPIVYGLGNWWFPQGVFMDSLLAFPPASRLELAFDWDVGDGSMRCHWFEYGVQGHTLQCVQSEDFEGSARVRELTPFSGMSHRDYARWFRANRTKRKLLPIYSRMDATFQNWLRDRWIWAFGMCIHPAYRLILRWKRARRLA